MIGIGGMLVRLYLLVVTVDGQSMAPALKPGDRVLVLRTCSRDWIRKSRIVLIDAVYTEEPTTVLKLFNPKPIIKRVVALEGEKVIISSAPQEEGEGHLFVQRVWDIPQGHVFVCGDNYKQSIDSRHSGPLPLNKVLGVMLMKLPRKAPVEPKGLSQALSSNWGLPVGAMAPVFSAPTISGEIVTLHTYQGQDLLLLFINHTELSRKNMPFFLKLIPKATAAGISIVFVSMSSAHKTHAFVEEWHITLPVLIAPRDCNPMLDDYVVPGAPFYCFIDAQGRVRASGRTTQEFFAEIETLRQCSGLLGNAVLGHLYVNQETKKSD